MDARVVIIAVMSLSIMGCSQDLDIEDQTFRCFEDSDCTSDRKCLPHPEDPGRKICRDPNDCDTQRDPSNCGACGVACGPGELCVEGQCACVDRDDVGGLPSCSSGIRCAGHRAGDDPVPWCANVNDAIFDCESDRQRSCSPNTCVDILTDESNCGGCRVVCETGESCVFGFCE